MKPTVAHELILGGARSGKSRTAEARAAAWLAASAQHQATLVATALAGDDEMAARIARHRADRAARLPALHCVEAAQELGATLRRLARPQRLLVVDCLTLWLTQWLLPPPAATATATTTTTTTTAAAAAWAQERDDLLTALRDSVSPIVLVSNEIGLGVLPLSREARGCVDALGHLHQALAAHCPRVTLMVAGCELRLKDGR